MFTLLNRITGTQKLVYRIDLREPENEVITWTDFVARYKKSIENLEIQLERGGNYRDYQKLVNAWKDLGIESWFLVREILHTPPPQSNATK